MTTGKIDGIATKDPAFGSRAIWIDPGLARPGRDVSATRWSSRRAVLATHLTEDRAAGTPTKFSRATRRSIWSTS